MFLFHQDTQGFIREARLYQRINRNGKALLEDMKDLDDTGIMVHGVPRPLAALLSTSDRNSQIADGDSSIVSAVSAH